MTETISDTVHIRYCDATGLIRSLVDYLAPKMGNALARDDIEPASHCKSRPPNAVPTTVAPPRSEALQAVVQHECRHDLEFRIVR